MHLTLLRSASDFDCWPDLTAIKPNNGELMNPFITSQNPPGWPTNFMVLTGARHCFSLYFSKNKMIKLKHIQKNMLNRLFIFSMVPFWNTKTAKEQH